MRELITDSACLTVSVFPSASEMIFKERKEGGRMGEGGGLHTCGIACLRSGSRQVSLWKQVVHPLGWEKTARQSS